MSDLDEQVLADQAKLVQDLDRRLERAGEYVRERLREAVGRRGSKDSHAPKGEPPYTQTGRLLDSIKVRLEGQSVVIYSDCEYGKFVEQDHPWFLSTIEECEAETRRIIFEGG